MMKLDIQKFADNYTYLAQWGTYWGNSKSSTPSTSESYQLDLKANYNIYYLQKNGKTIIRIQPFLRAYSDRIIETDWNINVKVYARVTNSATGNTYKYSTVHVGTTKHTESNKITNFYGGYLDFEITPNSKGESTCQFTGYFIWPDGDTSNPNNCYNTYKLPTISVSTILSNNTSENSRIDFGQKIKFTASSQNSEIINTLSYIIAGTTYNIGTITGNNSLEYTFSTDLINKFANSDIANIVVNCKSSNSTETSTNVYLRVPNSYIPTASLSIEDVGQTQFANLWILNKSKLKGTISATGIAGSTIKSYSTKISNFNQTYNSNPFTTQNLSVSGKRVITSKVTDSRNRSVTITKEITVVDYHVPTYVETKVERCNSDGTINNEGSYAKVTCKYKISSINNLNLKKIKIKKDSGSEQEFELSSYEGTYSSVLYSGILQTQQYDFTFILVDSFGNATPQVFTLPTSETLISKFHGGKGITFGRIATEEGLHDYLGANFHNGLKMNGVDVSVGRTLWSGNLTLTKSITVPSLNDYNYLEFHIERGTDFGSTIVRAKKSNRHACAVLSYTTDDRFYVRIVNIYWTTDNVVTLKNSIVLKPKSDNTMDGWLSVVATENEALTAIVGYM